MPEEFYDKDFPNLKRETWIRTSDPANYNCIAFVAGDETRYWWPNLWYPDPSDAFWPIDRHDLAVETFVEALATRGFSLSTKDDGRLEFGIQKAAIYALNKEVK